MRRGFVVKRSSNASAGAPTARHTFSNSRSLAATIISSPSTVSNTWYGTISGKAVPWRPAGAPPARTSTNW